MFQNSNYGTTENKSSKSYPPLSPNEYMMPNPTSWNIHNLNWNFEGVPRQHQNVQQFTAFTTTASTSTMAPTLPGKRKTIEPSPIYRPTKQFISEQKMIEHLNSMHLSSDFTNHNISPDTFEENYKVFLSPADLEQKLRNAQRITVCEQIKTLTKNDNVLPKALLDRANASSSNPPYCSALVLWQPPTSILKFCDKNKDEEEESEEKQPKIVSNPSQMESEDLFMDNNNSSTIDLNNLNVMNEMEMDDL
uniref:CSON011078 protein n=1 Tax=Culicoides sonorensis TaxID=179676 RepID=A0A336LYX5_CULSO